MLFPYVVVSDRLGHVRMDKREAGDLSVMGLCMRAGPHQQYLLVPVVNAASKAEVVGSCTQAAYMRGERHTEIWCVYIVASIDACTYLAVALALAAYNV